MDMQKRRIFITAILVQALVLPLAASAFSVAVLTDVHADKYNKIENKESNTVIYPQNYKRCLNEVKSLKPDLVIATGDLANRGQNKYYGNLQEIMRGTQTLWVKGNHDSRHFSRLASDNYYTDFENWRFIVLDSSEKFGSSTGYLDDSQISQFNEWLKTDKNVAIAMHHPPFFYDSRNGIYTSEKNPQYNDFFNALTPNVKYVFTGHWHFDQSAEVDGATFLTQKALTQDNKCNYTILNL
jgi:3',5'-cyclic AMP phosphodiesterase CpdA